MQIKENTFFTAVNKDGPWFNPSNTLKRAGLHEERLK